MNCHSRSYCSVKLKFRWAVLFVIFTAICLFAYTNDFVYYKLLHIDQACFVSQAEHNQILFVMQKTAEELTSLNITWWLADGSLLGAMRYQDILPWDYDGDMAYLYKDEEKLTKLLPNAMEKHRIKFSLKPNQLATYQLLYETVHVDIYAFAPYTDCMHIHPNPLPNYTNKTMAQLFEPTDNWYRTIGHCRRSNVEDFFPLRKCSFGKQSMWCPHNSVKVLADHYCFSYWLPFSFSYKFDCYIKPWNLWKIVTTPWTE